MNKRRRLALALIALLGTAATTTAQGPELGRLMRRKLEVSQKILDAVVTSRWAELEARSRDLEDLTRDPAWTVLKSKEYARHSNTFRAAVRVLRTAAAQRDLDKTPQAYITVTLSCVECHRYLARNRLAGE